MKIINKSLIKVCIFFLFTSIYGPKWESMTTNPFLFLQPKWEPFEIMTFSRPYLFNKCTWLGCKEVTCSTKISTIDVLYDRRFNHYKTSSIWIKFKKLKKEKRHECFNQPQSYYISHSINLHSSLSNHRMKNNLSQPLSN